METSGPSAMIDGEHGRDGIQNINILRSQRSKVACIGQSARSYHVPLPSLPIIWKSRPRMLHHSSS